MTDMTPEQEKTLIDSLDTAAHDLLTLETHDDAGAAGILPDLPEGTRQILTVERFAMYSANWIISTANPTVGAQPYILCLGTPTPSSDVTSGYIRFVEPSQVRPPSYSMRNRQINLYLDHRSMAQVHAQLAHSRRYLWVGHFAGGHYYGDLHSTP